MLGETARPAPNPAPALTPPASMGQRGTRFSGTAAPPSQASRVSVSPVAPPTERDVETMPTQKVFKQRVRARMGKTGESYTAARHQLLKKSEPEALEPEGPDSGGHVASPAAVVAATDTLLVADEAMVRATGRTHAEWFAILDGWGATDHTHTEIARWLGETHGTPGWWTQNITVSYERARGKRKPGQMADGFTVAVTRTLDLEPGTALQAFTDRVIREAWLPGGPMRQRPTRAANTARFDWADPPSRIVVFVAPKNGTRSTLTVSHEQLPDAATAERFKAAWRAWLGTLRSVLERP
jgi:hypothetical protein